LPPPPVSFTVRVWPTTSQSPVWSSTLLIGGMGPYHRRNRVGSGIGSVPSNALCPSVGISRDCSNVCGCVMSPIVLWRLRPSGLITADGGEHRRRQRPAEQDVDHVVLGGVHQRERHHQHVGGQQGTPSALHPPPQERRDHGGERGVKRRDGRHHV